MRFVVLDFETFFSDEFTLSKMSTENYIRDPRFKAHGAAIKWSKDHDAIWYDEPRLRQVLKDENWSDVFLISHHAQFDHLILSHHYAVVPRMSGCTLSMARLLLGNHISVSLDSVRSQFGLPAKSTPYNLFKGKHWRELTQHEQTLVAEGACDEVESIWRIFGLLAKDFPAEECQIVDQTIRMFTQPVLRADVDLLARIWEKEDREKRARLSSLDVTDADLQSADRFADLLRQQGVEPETKEGKPKEDGTPRRVYCFAKTDPFMEALLEDEDDRVRALAEARLGAKSTLLQTRAETLGWMASRGPLCVYLRMYGAHTTRWSGGDGSNFQNFKKPDPDIPETDDYNIQDAILSPEGYLLVKPDASQIECVAEDTLVLTECGPKAIQSVRLSDRVWDGQDFVAHQGIVFKGIQEVISYQGLTATPEHIIYPRGNRYPEGLSLQAASELGLDIQASAPTHAICATKVPIQKMPGISTIRSARHTISFRDSREGNSLGVGESTAPDVQRRRDRPNQQRRPLRTWKFEIIHALGKCQQLFRHGVGICAAWMDSCPPVHAGIPSSVQVRQYQAACKPRSNRRTDRRKIKKQKNVAPVYDILNCGPHFRFWANGVIVSNCRLLNFLAGQDDVIERFRNGDDPYVNVASQFYGFPVNKKDHPNERQCGKVLELQAGYGSGGPKICATMRVKTKGRVLLTPEEGIKARDAYRDTHPAVTDLWKTAGRMLSRLAGGDPVDWGPTHVRDGKIYLPNSCPLKYETLEYFKDPESGDGYWRLKTRRGWTKMYGAKLVENWIQALARVVISQAFLRVVAMGYRVVSMEHDSLWILIPQDGKEAWHLQRCADEIKRTPAWLPGIPLDCEASL